MTGNVNFTSSMFLAILVGLVVTLAAGFIAIKAAFRVGLVDVPGAAPHKLHRIPTPLAGGITLVLALLVLTLIFGTWKDTKWAGILIGASIVLVFGIWDDKKMLPAWVKSLGQIIAAVVLISTGTTVQMLEALPLPFHLPNEVIVWLDYGITVFWVVAITNAFNLVDSMDGLVAGLTSSAFAAFMLAALDSQQFSLARECALMFGICFGLNFLNASPARLFLGDGGAQTLGFILAVVAIVYNPLDRLQTTSWFIPVLLVAVPIFDMALVSISRFRRKIPFYQAGREHTYHRLVALGLDTNRAVLLMNLTAIVLDCIAFVAMTLTPLAANLIFFGCVLLGLVVLGLLDSRRVWRVLGIEPGAHDSNHSLLNSHPTDGVE